MISFPIGRLISIRQESLDRNKVKWPPDTAESMLGGIEIYRLASVVPSYIDTAPLTIRRHDSRKTLMGGSFALFFNIATILM